MKWIKKLLCEHNWKHAGWSYIQCTKCEKVRYDPEMNAELMGKWMNNYYKNEPEELDKYERLSAFKR